MTDERTVRLTCEQRGFMKKRVVYVYDSSADVSIGDRVVVDNRRGIREGTVRGIDFGKLPGSPRTDRRRFQIHLDPLEP